MNSSNLTPEKNPAEPGNRTEPAKGLDLAEEIKRRILLVEEIVEDDDCRYDISFAEARELVRTAQSSPIQNNGWFSAAFNAYYLGFYSGMQFQAEKGGPAPGRREKC